MAVTKRARFEVLKRDAHTCQYCGEKAPDVTLHIDHVIPVSLGGTDDPGNLVAACKDCNLGKASSSPDAEAVAAVQADAIRWAAALQEATYRAAARLEEPSALYEYFEDEWNYRNPAFADLPSDLEWKPTIAKFYGMGLDVSAIDHAIDLAAGRDDIPRWARWKYFCGICWNKVRDLQDEARAILAEEEV